MTTVRLPVEIEQKLEAVSKNRNRSKSDLIKEALEVFFSQEENEKDSYEIGKVYFGKFGSENGGLSINYKKILKEKLRAKHSSR
jgi:Arc/MetJ-type ribon-helix-helix transcriptional regulator